MKLPNYSRVFVLFILLCFIVISTVKSVETFGDYTIVDLQSCYGNAFLNVRTQLKDYNYTITGCKYLKDNIWQCPCKQELHIAIQPLERRANNFYIILEYFNNKPVSTEGKVIYNYNIDVNEHPVIIDPKIKEQQLRDIGKMVIIIIGIVLIVCVIGFFIIQRLFITDNENLIKDSFKRKERTDKDIKEYLKQYKK